MTKDVMKRLGVVIGVAVLVNVYVILVEWRICDCVRKAPVRVIVIDGDDTPQEPVYGTDAYWQAVTGEAIDLTPVGD